MSVSDSGKRKITRIGTHNGKFHCDEALACYMLKTLDEFADAEITRTRDSKVLNDMDVVVDVGGEYDAEAGRFDHHQRGFTDTLVTDRKTYNTKLSSAGLIYKHYGHQVISKLTGCTDEETVDELFHRVYESFVEALDGIDNGISQYPADLEPAYKSSTDLPSRVGRLNPSWNQEDLDEDVLFKQAMQLAGGEFAQCVQEFYTSWLPARNIVAESLDASSEYAADNEILVLQRMCPWKEHLVDLEAKRDINVKYVLFPDRSKGYRIQAVPIRPDSFELRLGLPEPWRGMRDEKLDEVTGVPGGVFVHINGFIGGHSTFEGALELAQKALAFYKEKEMTLES